jgi:hypothetical protein
MKILFVLCFWLMFAGCTRAVAQAAPDLCKKGTAVLDGFVAEVNQHPEIPLVDGVSDGRIEKAELVYIRCDQKRVVGIVELTTSGVVDQVCVRLYLRMVVLVASNGLEIIGVKNLSTEPCDLKDPRWHKIRI